MGGLPKIDFKTRLEAFRYYFPIPEGLLMDHIRSRAPYLEKHIIDVRWILKHKKLTEAEQIYKEWCNGKSYTALAISTGKGRGVVMNAINKTREQLIKEILQDAEAGRLRLPVVEKPPRKKSTSQILKVHSDLENEINREIKTHDKIFARYNELAADKSAKQFDILTVLESEFTSYSFGNIEKIVNKRLEKIGNV